MNIGLVANTLLKSKKAGVEKYTYELYNALSKVDNKNKYTIYFNKKPSQEYFDKLTNNNKNFNYKVIKPKSGLFNSWVQILLHDELNNNPVDVVFYPNDTTTGLSHIKGKGNFKSVSVIHDLGYKVAKEYKNTFKQYVHTKTIEFVLKNSKKVIVPSYFVKNKILNEYSYLKKRICEQNKLEVIYEGLNSNFLNSDKISKKQIDEVKKQYNIDDNYLYAISSIQPRKNYINMIKAFALIVKENPNYKNIKLVITGQPLWDSDKVYKTVKDNNVQDNVIFLDNTPDDHIPMLLKGSMAYINTSFEEGFGLPVLEAMSCEKPLILSNIDTFKEIAQDNPVYVDPYNIESIKEGMLKIFCDTCLDNEIKNAKELSKKFTWETTAKKTIELLNNVYLNKI